MKINGMTRAGFITTLVICAVGLSVVLARTPKIGDAVFVSKNLSPDIDGKMETILAESLLAFTVLAQDIQINLDNHLINGFNEISIKSNISSLSNITLDFIGGAIDSIKQSGYSINYTRTDTLLNVYLRYPLAHGDSSSVRIFYRASPSRGFYWNTNSFNQPIWYSYNNLSDTRYWIPCVDKPFIKAKTRLTASVPFNMVCVGNGVLTGTWQQPGNNRVFYQWSENYPIAPSAISLSACAYSIISDSASIGDSAISLRYYVYPGDSTEARSDFANFPTMLSFIGGKLGGYGFPGEKLAVSENKILDGWGADGGQNVISFGDMLMTGQRSYEWLLARAAAKQWFGSLVTPVDWRHIWLDKGFTAYFDALFTQYKYGELSFQSKMADYKSGYLSDDDYSHYPIYSPSLDYIDSPLESEKAAWVVHMLRYMCEDSLFYATLRRYLSDSRYGNVSSDDLQSQYELSLGQNLDWFFEQWIYSSGHPDYRIGWTVQPYLDKFNLQIQFKQIQTNSRYFAMPIQVFAHSSLKDTVISISCPAAANYYGSALLDFNPTDITIDPNNWILKNLVYANPPDYVSELIIDIDSIYSFVMPEESDTIFLTIGNAGSANLVLSSSGDSSWLESIPGRLAIPPGEQAQLMIIFHGQALTPGLREAELELITNDPNHPAINIECVFMIIQQGYIAGDANGNGAIEGADVTFTVRFLKGIGLPPVPLISGDVNGDCLVAGSDVTYLVRYLKGLGNPPISGNCD